MTQRFIDVTVTVRVPVPRAYNGDDVTRLEDYARLLRMRAIRSARQIAFPVSDRGTLHAVGSKVTPPVFPPDGMSPVPCFDPENCATLPCPTHGCCWPPNPGRCQTCR